MCRKTVLLIIVISLTGVVNSVSAIVWTGAGDGISWDDANNWDSLIVPGQYDEAFINPPPYRGPIIDCDVHVGDLHGPRWDSDSNQVLDIISGTIVVDWEWRWGDGGSGTSIINISGSPHITVNETVRGTDSGKTEFNMSGNPTLICYDRFRVGDKPTLTTFNISGGSLSMDGEWKWGDEGDVVLNMSGGSIDIGGHWSMHCRDFSNTDVNMTGGDIWVGGEVLAADSARNTQAATINISAGTIDADSLLLPTQNQGTGILNMTGGSFVCRNALRVPNVSGGTGIINLDGGTISTLNFYMDEGGILDVNDGILIIDGDVVADIEAYVEAGYITAYNGAGGVYANYDSLGEKTIVSGGTAVTFETSVSSGFESVSTVILTVSLYPPEGNTVTVDYAATGGTANGNGVDYTLNPDMLTFNPGETSQTIEIAIINDSSDEEDETIEVTLSNPVNAVLGAIIQHTYTIIDPRPFVDFDDQSSNGREDVSPVNIPVSLSWLSAETVTVDYNVTGGTATGGEDYNLPAGTLQFDPYEMTQHISIAVVDDELDEFPDEMIQITLSNPGNGRLGTDTQHTFTILPPRVRLCPVGDLDGDCDVDFGDVGVFAGQWLDPEGSCSDFNCADIDSINGVDICDFALLAENWKERAWPLVINEFMASNAAAIEDPNEPNDFPDWFELYNASPIPLELGGMYLTDDLGDPMKWEIPAGVSIDAWGFLVFWADGDADKDQGPTHTNFQLSASEGEEIGLFDTDGSTLIDSFSFDPQTTDISYGLYPDASDNQRFFATPTPGWENNGAYPGEVADTKFSHDRGFYNSPFNLSITCDTPDANIYYTLNGSEPNESAGTLYTSPITGIDHTTVLRAAAFKPGYLPSNVDTQTYIFLDDVVNQPELDPTVVATYGGTAVVKEALESIPTLSIVMNQSDFNNLQFQDSTVDPDDPRAKKELPTSVELIYPDPNDGQGFQINCGIEGHSWPASELEVNQKRSYRLMFKSEFGPARLSYPFFEAAPVNSESAVDEFDRIIVRASKNEAVTYAGDQWTRDSQIAMSGIGSHGTYVHLYVNGTYWGVHNPVERPDAWFASAYFGGDSEDYFATNHGIERCDPYPVSPNCPCHIGGDDSRFDQMMELAYERNLADPSKYAEFTSLCDAHQFADYTILFWFSGFGDTMDNNWYAGMRNIPLEGAFPPEGFMMFMWDAEYVFRDDGDPPGWIEPWVPPHYFEDGWMISDIWLALYDNADFRMLFADRIYRHCFNNGALTVDNAQARWNALTDDINDAAITELARWPYRDEPATVPPEHVNMTGFVGIFMAALNNWGLYPSIDPPTMTPRGGYDPTGFTVTMSGPGTIYYTLDGSDPREAVTGNPVGTVYTAPIVLDKTRHVKARSFDDPNWSALNEATFAVGPVAENLRITEIMYHPQDTNDPNDPNTEFIELRNTGPGTLNLNLVRFTNGVDCTFPADIDIPAGGYVVVVKDQNAFTSRYPSFAGIIACEYTGSLNNAGERIELEDALGQTILNFRYEDGWREITDGDGFSLTIIDPNNVDPNSWGRKNGWRASAYISGSPGWDDSGIVPNPGAIVINELLAHSDAYPNDGIELHNTTAEGIDIAGWFLSDNASNLMKYEIPAPNTIPAGGYIVFTEDDHFGNLSDPGCNVPFALSENGEEVYLSSALDQNGVLTGYREVEDFGASENGVSFGRYYKGSTGNYNFVAMDHITWASANAYPKVGPIVINKIMYHPDWPDSSLYNNDKFEYVELCNISDSNVTLYDYGENEPWKFTDGIEF
ncbi:MAG: lamin tail domain-containing protein, partial [Planctomycetota bacterium]